MRKKFLFLMITVLSLGRADAQDTLLRYVYHPERLRIVKRDTTITGVVTRSRKEPDGDYHLRINGIEIECICQGQTKKVPAATDKCKDYKGPYVDPPRIGDRVTVSGVYVWDRLHLWTEIHPVRSLVNLDLIIQPEKKK